MIAAMKTNYRLFQIKHAADLTETNFKDIYSVGILLAMMAFKRIWKNMDKTVILKPWRHSRVLESPEQPYVAPAVNLQEAC